MARDSEGGRFKLSPDQKERARNDFRMILERNLERMKKIDLALEDIAKRSDQIEEILLADIKTGGNQGVIDKLRSEEARLEKEKKLLVEELSGLKTSNSNLGDVLTGYDSETQDKL